MSFVLWFVVLLDFGGFPGAMCPRERTYADTKSVGISEQPTSGKPDKSNLYCAWDT